MTLNAPTPEFLDGLRTLLGPSGWRAPEDSQDLLGDPRDRFRGHAAFVARPGSTDEVAELVRRCAEARVAIIPVSGGTGLVAGHVTLAEPAPLLLSLQRMNRIRDVNTDDDVIVAEAGAILKDVQDAAAEAGRLFPLSLASEGSCRIGGNLSTNAGGISTLRYGNARDLCLGVEAVLPDGTVLNGLKRLRKDNMCYDIRHLLIGGEGTLGIITAAALKLMARPAETATAWLAVPSPRDAVALLHDLRDRLGETISAFELIDVMGYVFLEESGMARPAPLSPMPPWSVLVEVGGQAGIGASFEAALAEAFEAGLATDGVIAQSAAQRDAFWAIRETIPLANRGIGSVSSHDVSLPLSRIADFVAAATAALGRLDPSLRINCFGHVGDGNLHYNVFPPAGATRAAYDNLRSEVKTIVYDLVDAHDGSVGAEHGVGRAKVADLEHYGDAGLLTAMRAVKAALDPLGIMNPGAVLR